MIQGKWGSYNLEETQKPQQQPAIPKILGPAFSTTAGSSYYKNNRIPTPSFAGDKVVQTTTPAIPPLQKMPNQEQFEKEFRESQEMRESDYGQTPGSAIIKDAATGKVLAQGSGPATGGFSRPKDADKYVQEEQNRANNFWSDIAKQKAMETADRQNSMMTKLDSAIRSGNQEQAAMLTNALKGVGAIQPMNYGATENQLAEARTRQAALPYIGPKAEAETGLQNAQAGYYSGRNTVELGSARAKALADVLAAKQKQTGKGALDPKNRIDLENMAMTNPEGYARLMKEFGIAG